MIQQRKNHQETEQTHYLQFLSGLLIGGLVGSALTMLMAPRSGEETRAEIRDQTVAVKDNVKHQLDDGLQTARRQADEMISKARHEAEELVSEAQHQAEEIQRRAVAQVNQAREEGRHQVKVQTDKVKNAVDQAAKQIRQTI